ncbi:hypothetical protein [Marinobacter sp. BGYM27]|uniref:hypothetical protein n=1 Tax=Marinobacter sp. BGYM27 TaxID=2975597 RepID=UPI0021A4478E|nr:hypothetical protein [Marinobacter sp. BGYM27]MDG5500154.1 hypothetical protein [Marinobacter sp. BGYM27]
MLLNVKHFGALALITMLGGCAAIDPPKTTVYNITTVPSGATIYKGPTPDNLTEYQTTPFNAVMTNNTSLRWSNSYFQARMEGYEDTEVFQQPMFPVGTPTSISFTLTPVTGTEEDLAPFRATNTIPAYKTFLEQYPRTPLRADVYELMIERAAVSGEPIKASLALAAEYPDMVPMLNEDIQLYLVGPEGLKVFQLADAIETGARSDDLVVAIQAADSGYRPFTLEEIDHLTSMGFSDDVITAMTDKTEAIARAIEAAKHSLVLANNTGRYMCPWTSDGVTAEWVDKAINANMGATAGSGLGAVAGSFLGSQLLDQVPGGSLLGGLVGGIAGSAAGEDVGRDSAIQASGGWEYIRATSDRSFNNLNDMAVYLSQEYGGHSNYQDVMNAAVAIYPELANHIR